MVSDESALLERLRAGDKTACVECIEQHGDSIYRLALRLTRNAEDAEDIVQETFLNAFKSVAAFEGNASLSTWLYRIAYNTALMHHRAKYPTVSIEAQEDEALSIPQQLFDWCCLPEQDFQTEEVRNELEQAIHELPETLRVVFILRELEGLSTQRCADALQVSVDVVKQRLHRARLWLRERLSSYFVEWV